MNRKMTVLLVAIGVFTLITGCSANKSDASAAASTAAGSAQETTQKSAQETTQDQTASKDSTVSYKQYANSRFGFSIEYPDTFATASSDNGDGTTLSSPDGSAVLTVSGSNNVLGDTVTTMYNTLLAEHSDASDKAYGDDWAAVSWISGDNIIYEKCVVGSGSVNTFVFKYPAAQKDYYKSIITYIDASFKTPGVGDSY